MMLQQTVVNILKIGKGKLITVKPVLRGHSREGQKLAA